MKPITSLVLVTGASLLFAFLNASICNFIIAVLGILASIFKISKTA